MFIERVEISGFGGLRRYEAALDRTARVAGSSRALVAFGDALLLAFASWDARALERLLQRWGCENVKIDGSPLPESATWDSAPGLAAVVDRASDNLLCVGLTMELDPPQFGKLRRLASRDSRLVDALSEGARVTVRVGARFSPALDAVGLDPLAFLIGAVSFPIAGADRPAWMTPFLAGLANRLWRGPLPLDQWAAKARSYAIEDQRAVRRALAALGEPPASLGDAVVLPDGPAVLDAEAVVPMRHIGAEGVRAAGLVGAVHLSGAEILVVEQPPSGWLDWLSAQAEADGSPLEQVFLLGADGGIRLE
jgi:hypothetical protein